MDFEIILSKKWTSCPSQLCDIRCSITTICSQLTFSEKDTQAIVLAIDEACSNIMRYAYNNCVDGTILIEVSTDRQQVVFRLHDYAKKVSKDCIKTQESSPLEPGGLGLMLMKEVMDCVDFVHTDKCAGNILEMRKTLPKEKD